MTKAIILSDGRKCLVDFEDWLIFGVYSWTPNNWGYPARGSSAERQYLHLEIAKRMGLDLSHRIDHENRNKLDCRRENLRAATHAQNMVNCQMRSHNTSGYRGVSFDKRENNGKRISRSIKRKSNSVDFSLLKVPLLPTILLHKKSTENLLF